MPENNGGVNCELSDAKWGGKNSGGCPLSNMGRKFPLQMENSFIMRETEYRIVQLPNTQCQLFPFRESLNILMTSETTGEHIINIIVLTVLRVTQ